ncbi:MAG: hypothetical protein NDI80_06785 [Flavobacteriaceae bacterium]|nr:hypothetical protein [Flavobacteriaceae bacterium]
MIKIKYYKERFKSNLRIGLLFLSIGVILIIISFFIAELKNISLKSIGFGQIGSGIFILILYNYELNKQYLIIENGIIKQNWPFGKKLNLTEIKQIKKFAGDYILKTDKKELTINTQIIDKKSLVDLNAELEKLNVEWK